MANSLADVTERLFRDLQPDVALADIIEVVRRCREDLDTAPAEALPELVERLARQRLTDARVPSSAIRAGR